MQNSRKHHANWHQTQIQNILKDLQATHDAAVAGHISHDMYQSAMRALRDALEKQLVSYSKFASSLEH